MAALSIFNMAARKKETMFQVAEIQRHPNIGGTFMQNLLN